MDKPINRILAVLELLQANNGLNGAELAQRIGVDRRTLRRYIVALEKLGLPIEASRGRDGFYALMPGYKLPPLMFSNDETLAISIGLRVASELGLSDMTPAVASTQAKLDRVMPKSLQRKIGNFNAAVQLDLASPQTVSASAYFALLVRCINAAQQVQIQYRARDTQLSLRNVDPYGLGYLYGAWYLLAYCHTRKALRSFRVDRMVDAIALPASFAKPAKLDVVESIKKSISMLPRAYQAQIIFLAQYDVVRATIPISLGRLTALKNKVRLDVETDDLQWLARVLAGLKMPFQIIGPVALKRALQTHLQWLSELLAAD